MFKISYNSIPQYNNVILKSQYASIALKCRYMNKRITTRLKAEIENEVINYLKLFTN